MKLTHQHHFAASVEDVISMLADEEFAEVRSRASGAKQSDAVVDGSPDGEFTVSIRRVVPATTIPQEFRAFVGGDLDVKYTEAWEAPGQAERVGTFAVEISGAPGHVAGALELTSANGGTDFLAVGTVSAPVPLLGPIIEKAVAAAVTKGFTAELEAADAWLAKRS